MATASTFHGHKLIGGFSTDEERKYCNDKRHRKVLRNPNAYQMPINYAEGYDRFTYMKAEVSLKKEMQWLCDHRNVLIEEGILDNSASPPRLNVDFILNRGCLTSLLLATADNRQIDIFVTRFRETYVFHTTYLSPTVNIDGIQWAHDDEDNDSEIGDDDEDNDNEIGDDDNRGEEQPGGFPLISYATKRLLQVMTYKKYSDADDTNEAINDSALYYGMMTVGVGDLRLLFSFEIHAERDDTTESPPRNLLNFRSCPAVNWQGESHTLASGKAFGWWAANVIAGIPTTICGWRDDTHQVIEAIEHIQTEDLPQMRYWWRPETCIRKLRSLLDEIKDLVQDDNPAAIYWLRLSQVEKGRGMQYRLRNRHFQFMGRVPSASFVSERFLRDVLGYRIIETPSWRNQDSIDT